MATQSGHLMPTPLPCGVLSRSSGGCCQCTTLAKARDYRTGLAPLHRRQ